VRGRIPVEAGQRHLQIRGRLADLDLYRLEQNRPDSGGLFSMDGTYEINGNRLTVTTTGLLGSVSGYAITEITSRSFFIDGVEFTRQ
jgi:hypothetical protein